MSASFPKLEKSGPVTQVTSDSPSFSKIPILKSWPKDAGRFITFGLTATKHPETGVRNLGVYRMQIVDETHALMHWQKHKTWCSTLRHFKRQRRENPNCNNYWRRTCYSFFSSCTSTRRIDKYLFAGITRKQGIKTVKCKTIDLDVPANAEIVLEGYVDPNDIREEGPFGDHTGYYTPVEPYPTFTLTGIMRREKPIYLTTIVGKPILEDAYIGKVIERSFLPLIRMFQPEVVDFAMPAAGWFQGFAIISIKKISRSSKKSHDGIMGLGQLALTKIFVVIDEDVNVHDMNDVI